MGQVFYGNGYRCVLTPVGAPEGYEIEMLATNTGRVTIQYRPNERDARRTIRTLTGMPLAGWAVADMDDGLLIVRDTRAECVEWAKEHLMLDRVAERHAYGGGAYEYTFRSEDPEDCGSVWIGRFPDAVQDHGWDPTQRPMFGNPAEPHIPTREDAYL